MHFSEDWHIQLLDHTLV